MGDPRGCQRARRVRRALLPGLLALAFARAAAGAEGPGDLDRWVPSFALSLGFLTQKAEGAITSGNVLGPPLTTSDELGTGCKVTNNQGAMSRNGGLCPGSDAKLSPDTSSSDTSVAPLVVGAFELMTPQLVDALGSPRLFAHADLSATLGFERNVAGERKPDRFVAPDLPPTQQDDIPEIAVSGQGTRATIELRRFVVSAGLGVAFTADLFGRTLRFKPSFEYLRQEVALEGRLHRAVKEESPARSFGTVDDFRQIRLRATEVEAQHGIGAGLEIEADASRLGPFALSIFVLARGYHFLGDLDYTLSSVNEFGETATWHFESEPWAWRGGAGLRFRWLPD